MKILVICQYYSPEPFRIADICEALVQEGNEVDVITSFPNYPMGEIYDGYKNGEHRDEIIKGVNVHRVFTIGRKTGALYRFINYYTYSIASTLYVSKLKKEYDVVFVYQLSPVMMAQAALKYKKKYGKKVVLYCLDLWPESLCIGGIRKNSFIYKVFEKISSRIYKGVDKLLVSSRTFKKHFSEKYDFSEDEIVYLPQHAEDVFKISSSGERETVNLTFAGNIGSAQNVGTIIKAAEILKEENICFNIVGDGTELENIRKTVEKLSLKNVVFHGRLPVEKMPEIYGASDALLVTLSADPVISMTLPGKVQSYMAAGKPIIGAADGEPAQIIKEAQCGFCASAENPEELAECIKAFLESDKEQLGKNALDYYEKNFRKEFFVSTLVKELKSQI